MKKREEIRMQLIDMFGEPENLIWRSKTSVAGTPGKIVQWVEAGEGFEIGSEFRGVVCQKIVRRQSRIMRHQSIWRQRIMRVFLRCSEHGKKQQN
ncbi:hypothetical protein DSECCO2_643080 [anaerobic digester metagenome]